MAALNLSPLSPQMKMFPSHHGQKDELNEKLIPKDFLFPLAEGPNTLWR